MSNIFQIPGPVAGITSDELHAVACVYDCLEAMLSSLWSRIEAGAAVEPGEYALLSRRPMNRAVQHVIGAIAASTT